MFEAPFYPEKWLSEIVETFGGKMYTGFCFQ